MENKLLNWVWKRKQEKGLSYREMEEKSSITRSHISNIMNGRRAITLDFCLTVSRAFGLNPILAILWAGVIPVNKEIDEISELIELYLSLDGEKRDMLRGIANYLNN